MFDRVLNTPLTYTCLLVHCTKRKFSITDFFVNVTTADQVTFTEEILNGELHSLRSGKEQNQLITKVLSNGFT